MVQRTRHHSIQCSRITDHTPMRQAVKIAVPKVNVENGARTSDIFYLHRLACSECEGFIFSNIAMDHFL